VQGGLTITARKGIVREPQSYICENPSCGKTFTMPLETMNLRAEESEPFLARPYCLKEVVPPNNETPVEEIHESEMNLPIDSGNAPKMRKQSKEPPTKMVSCGHHMGYLSERSKKEAIPEECIICEHIVECMLKTVTG